MPLDMKYKILSTLPFAAIGFSWQEVHELSLRTIAGLGAAATAWAAITTILGLINRNAKTIRGVIDAMKNIAKLAENQNKSSLQIEAVLEHLRVYISSDSGLAFEADSNGFFTWTSDSLDQVFEKEAEDMLGTGWMSAIHEDYREAVERRWKEALVVNKRRFHETVLLNNSKRVSFIVEPVPSTENLVRFVGFCRVKQD